LATYFSTQIKGKNVSLIGLSLGATMCLRIKDILGDRIQHMYLMAPGGIPLSRIRKEMIRSALRELSTEDMVRRSLGLEDSKYLDHFSRNFESVNAYFKILEAQLFSSFPNNNCDNFITYIKAAIDVDYTAQMKHYQDEISIIWGGKDKVFSSKHLLKIQSTMPRSKVYLLPELGHYLPLENPQQILNILGEHEIFTV